jgi:hypothetical protein
MFFCTSSAHSVCVRCVRSPGPTGKVTIKATIVPGTDLRTIESDTGSLLLLEPLPVELFDLSPHRAKLVIQPIMMIMIVVVIIISHTMVSVSVTAGHTGIHGFTERGTTTTT